LGKHLLGALPYEMDHRRQVILLRPKNFRVFGFGEVSSGALASNLERSFAAVDEGADLIMRSRMDGTLPQWISWRPTMENYTPSSVVGMFQCSDLRIA
jgi:hypothetical protein